MGNRIVVILLTNRLTITVIIILVLLLVVVIIVVVEEELWDCVLDAVEEKPIDRFLKETRDDPIYIYIYRRS